MLYVTRLILFIVQESDTTVEIFVAIRAGPVCYILDGLGCLDSPDIDTVSDIVNCLLPLEEVEALLSRLPVCWSPLAAGST